MTRLTSCLWFCLVVRTLGSVGSQEDLYHAVGDSVLLRPDISSVKEPITSIVWKLNGNLAFVLEDGESEPYRQFKGQALNVTTAALTLTGLTGNFSGKYEVEVNGKPVYSTLLKVMSPVSKPTVTVSCDEGRTSCVLSCEGDPGQPITTQDQVDWMRDDKKETHLPKQLNITKERDADYKQFSCVLVNKVSEESSNPVPNPLSMAALAPEKAEGGPKWVTGLTVLISLLTVMIVLALVHRAKAGFWFYDTESMPWEADFWRRSETAGADQAANGRASSNAEAAESNGTSADREQRRHEEDGLMAETAIP